jgi:hypothetical protein
VANIGIVWSQDNVEFGGGLMGRNLISDSWRGIVMALTRAGLPFLPINIGDLDSQSKDIDLLILPEFAVVSDKDITALKAYADRGGSFFVCGATGLYDENGTKRDDSVFQSLLGVKRSSSPADLLATDASWENPVLHNYLRIEAAKSPIFKDAGNTATLPMGGIFTEIVPDSKTKVLGTYIPPYPIYPPEFAWTSVPKTEKAVLTEYDLPQGGKTVYAAWDLDAVYGRAALPDHGNLIANIAKHLLGDRIPVQVDCKAYIDFKVYRQENRLIIHLINGNHTGFAQGYAEENLSVGPVNIRINLPDITFTKVWATEDNQTVTVTRETGGNVNLGIDRLGVHQLIIVEF